MPVVYLQCESGELNTLVHFSGFENAADRERRVAMMADPEFAGLPEASDESGISRRTIEQLDVAGRFRADQALAIERREEVTHVRSHLRT